MVEPHGKPRWRRRPWEIELLEALYADAMVCGVLDRHGVPIAPLSGPGSGPGAFSNKPSSLLTDAASKVITSAFAIAEGTGSPPASALTRPFAPRSGTGRGIQ